MIYFLSPVLVSDIDEYFFNIKSTACYLLSLNCDFKFIACIQYFCSELEPHVDSIILDFVGEIILLKTSFIGVSSARNSCFSYVSENFEIDHEKDVFVFYDSKVVYDKSYLFSLTQFELSDYLLHLGDIIFVKKMTLDSVRKSLVVPDKPFFCSRDVVLSLSRINFFKKCYVSVWAFRYSAITDISFNPDWGPGDSTYFKAGEDVLFFYDLLRLNPDVNVIKSSGFACRENRSSDLSKHLDYGFGHGAVLGLFLKKWPFRYFLYTSLFVFNSFRFFLLGRRGCKLALLRLSGLIYFYRRKRYEDFDNNG